MFQLLFYLSIYFIYLSQIVPPQFPNSPIWSLEPWYIPVYCSLQPQQWFRLTFLVSATISQYVLTSVDLEVGTSDEREQLMFVFPGLSFFTQYDLF